MANPAREEVRVELNRRLFHARKIANVPPVSVIESTQMALSSMKKNIKPTEDGEINRYVNEEASGMAWFDHRREVVFVNGMANSGENHMDSALALSLLQGCPVIGVYNKKDGFWSDLGQCLMDKGVLVGAQAGSFSAWSAAFDVAYAAAAQLKSGLTKIDFMESLVASNKATASLYRYVAEMSVQERSKLKIFCHSQGNLITSNALTAVALALGEDAIKNMEVNSFGSPCRYWPPGLDRTNNAFTFDPVSWLDYNIGFSSVKVGFTPGLISHGFDIYMNQDAEFVVNRFRWGSFRMTASMDEKGLATYLTKMGNNPRRLKKIFEWLDKHHNSDADDVAVIYSKLMRTKHAATMKALANADKSFITLLIKCMDEGWTASDEKKEIEYLKSL